jgi:hypothetical protein
MFCSKFPRTYSRIRSSFQAVKQKCANGTLLPDQTPTQFAELFADNNREFDAAYVQNSGSKQKMRQRQHIARKPDDEACRVEPGEIADMSPPSTITHRLLPLDRPKQNLVLEGCVDTIEQFFFAERFDEVASNPGTQRARTNGVVGVGRNQYRGNWIPCGNQLAIKRQPACPMHLHICYEAGCDMQAI